MVHVKYSNICLLGAVTIFAIFSKIIFDKIYVTSNVIVDEEFHLTLGKAYCEFDFEKWHPKVTTFPGLYLVSSLLLGAFNLCSIYWLRFVSLLFSFVNIFLFYYYFHQNNDEPSWKNVISAINVALLPPLYFFSHLYYTDVVSLTMIMLLFIFSQRGNHYLASIFGMLSLLLRQTNIIWIGMVFGTYLLQELHKVNQRQSKRTGSSGVTLKELTHFLRNCHVNLSTTLKQSPLSFWLNVTCYTSLLIFFALFIYVNGGIVVGDKRAHEVTIHLPQIFYFALFCLFFGWPHFVGEVLNFLRFVRVYKFLTLFFVLLSLVIVYYNTLVHPYLLADNRHYIFYIWGRFYGKYLFFRYLIIPVYLFSLFVILTKIFNKRDVSFLLFFIPCTVLVLITQQLLEFRYFFVPYILFRSHLKHVSTQALFYEFLTSLIINACTLHLFFTKIILWHDFEYPQRLIW